MILSTVLSTECNPSGVYPKGGTMEGINYQESGIVFNIQRFSIHDGPGIRTIVFLKGCPLACKWCSNPESQSPKPQVLYNKNLCMGCMRCVQACSLGAISPGNPGWINRNVCTGCGVCAKACTTKALELKGQKMTVEQVIQILKKDSSYYHRSDGGITLSGGEPLRQSAFARELLKACQSNGWHTAIETTAMVSEQVIKEVLPFVDLVLLDIKNTDGRIHQEYTGQSNEVILKNALSVAQMTQTVVRIPVIPGFNMDTESVRKIGRFAKKLPGVKTVHLLPYHTYGQNKYELLGKSYPLAGVKNLRDEDVENLRLVVEQEGFTCLIGG